MRLARVGIDMKYLTELMTVGTVFGGAGTRTEVVEGLPPGAELVRSFMDEDYGLGVINLVFYHDSFANVELGAPIPLITPGIHTEVVP